MRKRWVPVFGVAAGVGEDKVDFGVADFELRASWSASQLPSTYSSLYRAGSILVFDDDGGERELGESLHLEGECSVKTFISHEGVEPTNNAAERSLRGPVIHRKLSYGTRTTDGEHFIEHALSASVTCRLQKRSLFAYLTDLLTAQARGHPLPTLT